jgi:hypothetical protein
MINERLCLLAFPLPQLSLFLLILSLSKVFFGAKRRECKAKGVV